MLFYKTLTSMGNGRIREYWEEIGFYGDMSALMYRCRVKPTDAEYRHIEQCMPEFVLRMIRDGIITDAYMTEKGIKDEWTHVDGKAMKSQRVVLMTHVKIVAQAMKDLAEAARRQQASRERKIAREEKKAMQTRVRQTKKPASGKRKAMSQAMKAQLRNESKEQKELSTDVPNDCKCHACDAKWSVFLKHADEYHLQMFGCELCGKYWCSLCIGKDGQEGVLKLHEVDCKVTQMGRIMQALVPNQGL